LAGSTFLFEDSDEKPGELKYLSADSAEQLFRADELFGDVSRAFGCAVRYVCAAARSFEFVSAAEFNWVVLRLAHAVKNSSAFA